MKLLLVESPTKAKTLSKFLGGEYKIEATYGHIRDLPEKKLGVEIVKEKDRLVFVPDYVQTAKQKDRLKEIKTLSGKADDIYLATDPDREGEAIAWHVDQELKNSKSQKNKTKRITFHEITRNAVEEAISHAREIDMQLVDAQQTRRILDRVVGYKLSPLLWKKVRKGLSAGRVQSVAVRLVVDREREIEAFKAEEYWDISVELKNSEHQKLKAKLRWEADKELKVGNGDRAGEVKSDLEKAGYEVAGVEEKEFKRTPPGPFTTSTLQQAAANRLGWSAKKTMQVAQGLYEEGFITYHRTDSMNIAAEAMVQARQAITEAYGRDYLLDQPRLFKTKNKVAQEAHEAIRPSHAGVNHLSSQAVAQLNRDQQRLYELIWKRFVACQMAEARGVTAKARVAAKYQDRVYGLEAKGETVHFDGWSRVYAKDTEADENKSEEDNKSLPKLYTGEQLLFAGVDAQQKFTQPPARYNDAGLIKTMEEMGIGRPSTYAPTLSTIQDRQYVERVEKRFKPTPLGIAVSDFLVNNFAKIVDYSFTAKMEDELDEVAEGKLDWQKMLAEFYDPFIQAIDEVGESAERVKVQVETTGDKCPKCQEGDVIVRIGKFGRFLACSRYPECDYKANFQNKIGVKCPKCEDGEVIMRKTRSGKNFFGCSNYPKCDFASWTKPAPPAAEPAAKPAA